MPRAFENCVKKGGRVRTVTGKSEEHGLSHDEYVKYCYLNGKSYRGHVHKKKKPKTKSKTRYV